MLVNEAKSFRELCRENGIAVTHQRQVLYEVMKTMHGHPSPEEVYARVKKKVPAISLATVYKNIHLFVESGVFFQSCYGRLSSRPLCAACFIPTKRE